MNFFIENAGTIVTALVVAGVVFLAVRKIVKDIASGKSLCGGSCSACGGGCHIHGKNGECPAMKKTIDKINTLDDERAKS